MYAENIRENNSFFPLSFSKAKAVGKLADRFCQSVKKLPKSPLFLYNKEKGAFSWKSGEKMCGERHSLWT